MELKSRNEEPTANHAKLIEENAKVISQMDGMKDKLDREKAVMLALSQSWRWPH